MAGISFPRLAISLTLHHFGRWFTGRHLDKRIRAEFLPIFHWINHFKGIYVAINAECDPGDSSLSIEASNIHFMLEEVTEVIQGLSSNKAPGLNGIPSDLFFSSTSKFVVSSVSSNFECCRKSGDPLFMVSIC